MEMMLSGGVLQMAHRQLRTAASPALPSLLFCAQEPACTGIRDHGREREMKDVPRARSASVILKCTLKDCSKRKPFTLEET